MNSVSGSSNVKLETARTSSPRGLKTYDHQVAGQSLILQYDMNTICKCLTQREYQFYQDVPTCLLPFVPEFRGVIQLHLPEMNSYNKFPKGFSCSDSLQYCTTSEDVRRLEWDQNHCHLLNYLSKDSSLDPARLRALRKTTRIKRNGINDNVCHFMLLEDLLSCYKNPCILDLKLGVRQHGDDATPEKVAYQVNKCKTTTSASLGLRLCGMKRYNVLSGVHDIRDKIYGRQLTDDDLKAQIVNFLFNGQDFRSDLVDTLLYKLTNLKNVIEQLDGYRFYSSSLLITYEGTTGFLDELGIPTPINNQSETRYSLECQNDESENIQSSKERLSGDELEDIVQKTAELLDSPSLYKTYDYSPCLNDQIQSYRDIESYYRFNSSSLTSKETHAHLGCLSMKNQTNMVDIHVVDFAHATFAGFLCDPVKHCGPDHGFLLGINTLIEVFTELKERDVL